MVWQEQIEKALGFRFLS
jgi:hypothetical protein